MNWKRATITTALMLPVIGILAFGLTRDPKVIDSPLPGKPAPDFNLAVFAPGEGQLARASRRHGASRRASRQPGGAQLLGVVVPGVPGRTR